jgi:hypothetical protein
MWIRFALFNAALAAILTARPRPALLSLSVQPSTYAMAVGEQRDIDALTTGVAAPSARLRYTIRDTLIATVDSAGHLVAHRAGTTSLAVTATGAAEGFLASEIVARVPVVVR